MSSIYASASEAAQHEAAIDALAAELRRPVAEIKKHYEQQIERLQEGARLRDFLSVCAVRHTREAVRRGAALERQRANGAPAPVPL